MCNYETSGTSETNLLKQVGKISKRESSRRFLERVPVSLIILNRLNSQRVRHFLNASPHPQCVTESLSLVIKFKELFICIPSKHKIQNSIS